MTELWPLMAMWQTGHLIIYLPVNVTFTKLLLDLTWSLLTHSLTHSRCSIAGSKGNNQGLSVCQTNLYNINIVCFIHLNKEILGKLYTVLPYQLHPSSHRLYNCNLLSVSRYSIYSTLVIQQIHIGFEFFK